MQARASPVFTSPARAKGRGQERRMRCRWTAPVCAPGGARGRPGLSVTSAARHVVGPLSSECPVASGPGQSPPSRRHFVTILSEGRDVSELGSREVLVARDVLHREGVNGCVWRGCGPSVEMNVNISLCVLHSLGGFTCATWKKKKEGLLNTEGRGVNR